MGQIQVLDQNMINMIAAGEVIERPASVVKELMENSIDAGATKIIIDIEDGGRKLIKVTDNGCGMDAEDLNQAFEPHTTSKIKTSADLSNISTLGFRGEALASVASVAQIRAISRPVLERSEGTKNAHSANCVEIDCGNKGTVSPCSADYGTSIEVRNLFYKLPARRKFLRTANTEMTHITEQFIRIALGSYFSGNLKTEAMTNISERSNQGLDMTLTHNSKEIYRLLENENLFQRISELFSTEIAENLIETKSDEKGLHIYALLGKPSISRTSSKFQYIFLNGRFIRDKFISHAIKEAYRGLIIENRFPVIFLFIQMPYRDYDVNVHPTKIEVRFYNANLVHSQILGALREKLLATDLQTQGKLPTIGSYAGHSRSISSHRSQQITDAMAEFFRKHRPIQTQQQSSMVEKKIFDAQSYVVDQIVRSKPEYYKEKISSSEANFLQIHNSYIVEQTDDGFIIIDQHALHERILYEKLSQRIQICKLESQKLLIPESFEVTESETEVIRNNYELFERLGIELVPFGPRTYSIQAFPVLLSRAAPVEFVQDLICIIESKGSNVNAERLFDEMLSMAACKAAIKAGQKLSDEEIQQLLKDREHTECASRCPHGRPTIIKLTLRDLEKQFKRT